MKIEDMGEGVFVIDNSYYSGSFVKKIVQFRKDRPDLRIISVLVTKILPDQEGGQRPWGIAEEKLVIITEPKDAMVSKPKNRNLNDDEL